MAEYTAAEGRWDPRQPTGESAETDFPMADVILRHNFIFSSFSSNSAMSVKKERSQRGQRLGIIEKKIAFT